MAVGREWASRGVGTLGGGGKSSVEQEGPCHSGRGWGGVLSTEGPHKHIPGRRSRCAQEGKGREAGLSAEPREPSGALLTVGPSFPRVSLRELVCSENRAGRASLVSLWGGF